MGPKVGGGAPEISGARSPRHTPQTIDVLDHKGPKHAEGATESICKRQLPQALKSQLSHNLATVERNLLSLLSWEREESAVTQVCPRLGKVQLHQDLGVSEFPFVCLSVSLSTYLRNYTSVCTGLLILQVYPSTRLYKGRSVHAVHLRKSWFVDHRQRFEPHSTGFQLQCQLELLCVVCVGRYSLRMSAEN